MTVLDLRGVILLHLSRGSVRDANVKRRVSNGMPQRFWAPDLWEDESEPVEAIE